MTQQIPAEELSKETRDQLGITLPPALGEVGSNLIVLGKVFNAIKGLEDDEALQVLRQAQMYLISRMNGHNTKNTFTPGDGVSDSHTPPIEWTLEVTAKIFKLKTTDLKQRRKDAKVALARQVAMYVLCMTNKYTFTQIGLAIGGRSPSTVSYAFARIVHAIIEDENLREKVQKIQGLI